jgi:hypothetical protein
MISPPDPVDVIKVAVNGGAISSLKHRLYWD